MVQRLAYAAREERESVMVGAVAQHVAVGIAEAFDRLLVARDAVEIESVGQAEAEQVGVEGQRLRHRDIVEAEMAEAADLEWAVEKQAANVIFFRCGCVGHGDLDMTYKFFVIAGLGPAIHEFLTKSWMPGTSLGMTIEGVCCQRILGLRITLLVIERFLHQLTHREMRRVGTDIDRPRVGHAFGDALLCFHHHDVFIEDTA
jgi:hypothetical protein